MNELKNKDNSKNETDELYSSDEIKTITEDTINFIRHTSELLNKDIDDIFLYDRLILSLYHVKFDQITKFVASLSEHRDEFEDAFYHVEFNSHINEEDNMDYDYVIDFSVFSKEELTKLRDADIKSILNAKSLNTAIILFFSTIFSLVIIFDAGRVLTAILVTRRQI